MLNYRLKSFLKYLRANDVIQDYQMFFDRLFNYSKLLELDDDAVSRIYAAEEGAPIVLYEELHNIKIPDNVYGYIMSLKSKELQKYAVRMAIGKYNGEDSLSYITAVCEGKSEKSSRYAYSIAINDKLDDVEDKREYISLVANSDDETAYQMRDLILENDFFERKNKLKFLNMVSPQKEYVATYMIKLYKDTNSTEHVHLLSYAIGETQARYTYSILRNKELMQQENAILLAFLVAQSEVDDGYKIISAIRDGDYGDIYERSKKIIHKEEKDIDVDELFKYGDLTKIIEGLSHMPDSKDIKSKEKTYN